MSFLEMILKGQRFFWVDMFFELKALDQVGDVHWHFFDLSVVKSL